MQQTSVAFSSLRRRLSAALLLAALCALHNAPAGQSANQLKTKRRALKQVKHQIQQVKQKINTTRERQGRVTRELRKAEKRIGRLTAAERRLHTRISAQSRRISQLRLRRRRLRSTLDESRKILANQTRAAYLMGRQSRLKLFLMQHNPATVERVITYYDYFMKARKRAITSIGAQARRLRKTETALETQRSELQQLHDRRKRMLSRLQDERTTRQHALQSLNKRLQNRSQKLASLKKNQTRLKDLIGSLRRALAEIPRHPNQKQPFGKLKGQLPWPLHGRTLAHFGQSKGGGQLHWQGVWLSAPQGKSVHAVANGRVVYVGWMPSYGLILILDHGDGYYSLYAHDQSVTAQTGQTVTAGEKIATAGDTGGHQRTGVYFEIRKGKTPLDPGHWLRHR